MQRLPAWDKYVNDFNADGVLAKNNAYAAIIETIAPPRTTQKISTFKSKAINAALLRMM